MKFQQQVHIEPVLSPADAPDDVILAITQFVGHIGAADFLQAGEIELFHPGFLDETGQQVANHAWVRKEQLVAVVVMGHGDRWSGHPVS
ncbi:hypothetical protein M911_04790 [Ectothiorhodospira haloalkaliphila]|uniref:Uncharacterized protein n=1 Tax=Ectothiorhodospira haloalkaliphila TaxID=421628 RepID=W8KYM1_9GAMM|nr:hypothetical protein M911_04790 [Ectothiorhodospira haloalkaliphila]